MAQPALPRPAADDRDEHDHIVVLGNATWADYQRHLEMRGEDAGPRITYLQGVIELMSPSRGHESQKSMIGRLVEAWFLEKGVDISPYGSWTLESKDAERGVEPDECYVLGDRPDPALPDLAIEVVWTSGGVNKLDVYRKLGVREVWIYRRGAFAIHGLRADTYERLVASEVLPGIDLELIAKYVGVQPMTRAVRELREALRAG
jgi:Uma2 family endonuclease